MVTLSFWEDTLAGKAGRRSVIHGELRQHSLFSLVIATVASEFVRLAYLYSCTVGTGTVKSHRCPVE